MGRGGATSQPRLLAIRLITGYHDNIMVIVPSFKPWRACLISERLNQENGKSYGTGFFGIV